MKVDELTNPLASDYGYRGVTPAMMQEKADEIKGVARNSCGIDVATSAFSFQIKLLIEQIDFIEGQIAEVEVKIREGIEAVEPLILTIPGIGYTLVDDRAGDATFVTAENHNITVAPGANLFRRPDSGDYSLATGSPAINVGLKFDWMETALDLAGSPRIVSRIPDLGCYEAKPSHFSVRIR